MDDGLLTGDGNDVDVSAGIQQEVRFMYDVDMAYKSILTYSNQPRV